MPRRGENIYKRKDGRWEARYVKEVSIDGTKKYGSVYAKTYGEVKAKQKQVLLTPKFKENRYKITVAHVMNEWLVSNKAQIKISSYQKYKTVIDKHIQPELGFLEVQYMTKLTVQQYAESLLEKGLSKTTVNDSLIILSMGLSFAEEKYNIQVPKVSLLKNQPKEMRVLTAEEQNILVKYLLWKDDVYSFGMLLALFTGVRIGELCALTWDDISESTISINKTVQRIKKGNATEVVLLPPKTKSSVRTIPIPQELSALINKRRSYGNVLQQDNGKPVEPRLLQLKFKKYTAECGIDNINFHALRHSFSTRCIEIGFDVKTLSEILGHSDVKTTLNKYVHSTMMQKAKQMNMLKFNIAI